jgi:DNA-binding GntR family transcriptional regulator
MQSEHHTLLQTCERGDTDAATDILERHLLHSCAMVSASVRQLGASSQVR